MKVLHHSFHLNDNTLAFHSHTQKLDHHKKYYMKLSAAQ